MPELEEGSEGDDELDGLNYDSGDSDDSKIQIDTSSSNSDDTEDSTQPKKRPVTKERKKKKHEKLQKHLKKDKSLSVAGTRTNKLNERNKSIDMTKHKLKRKRSILDSKKDKVRLGVRDKNFKGHTTKKSVKRKV